jgi:hypothetical protein
MVSICAYDVINRQKLCFEWDEEIVNKNDK